MGLTVKLQMVKKLTVSREFNEAQLAVNCLRSLPPRTIIASN